MGGRKKKINDPSMAGRDDGLKVHTQHPCKKKKKYMKHQNKTFKDFLHVYLKKIDKVSISMCYYSI